jgi:hypothetical protein
VISGVVLLAGYAATTSPGPQPAVPELNDVESVGQAAREVDAHLQSLWEQQGITPAAPADELAVLRRLSLALHGTVPSLEELRRFEVDRGADRLDRWTAAMLEDPRFSDYFADRLGRAFVGAEAGQFIIFRRDRFAEWLRGELLSHRPYDEIVRSMIASHGVWTGEGEVNFLTAAYANDEFDVNKLTARTVRAFLGQRIDCAQCHDHPFDVWTQSQFEGLAAHYGQIGLSLAGVRDSSEHLFALPPEIRGALAGGDVPPPVRQAFREAGQRLRRFARIDVVTPATLWLVSDSAQEPGREETLKPRFVIRSTPEGLNVSRLDAEYVVEDRETLDERVVDPAVPFHPEWLGTTGTRRERLAAWVTHPQNRRFERAVANRIWGLLFGRPYLVDRPVDDLPSPEDASSAAETRVLDLLGADLRAHGCDLRRLIRVITRTRAFRMDSAPAAMDAETIEAAERTWGVFPLFRLRPEQVIGSMLQSHAVQTIDQESHLFVRAQRFFVERDFVEEFGDPGDHELEDRAGTIQQALLRMNGQFSRDMSEARPFSGPGRIAAYSSTPETLLENVFLVCFARRPTADERAHFLPQLAATGDAHREAVEDLFWTLFNSPEFSFNH